MRILWLVNIIMPELAVHLKQKPSVFGGWLSGAMEAVKESENELVVCTTSNDINVCGKYNINQTTYYVVKYGTVEEMSQEFKAILTAENPDIIHLYGTEFEHTWAFAKVSPVSKTLVTVQGSLLFYKDLTYGGIPEKICDDNFYHKLLRKIHKGGTSIGLQKTSFEKRSVYEDKTLKRLKYINGGSEWGNSVARAVNPNCVTLDCGLILRDSFYCDEMWSYDACEKHSIYILYTYPIKGFHKFLEALSIIKSQYPDTKVYVVGNKQYFRNYKGIKLKLIEKAPDYQWYVQKLIEQYGVKDNLEFVGYLDENQVKTMLLKANVFVSASAIENQSTALGEAMMLGVPSVASCVGAMQEMIDDGNDGFLYPFNEPHLLANNICKIFAQPQLAKQFSVKGHIHAAVTYSREENKKKLIGMYNTIYNNSKQEDK